MKIINQQYYHQQISSFNPSFCLRPPPPPLNGDSCSALIPSSYFSQHRRRLTDDEGPLSPKVGCMGHITRSRSCNNRSRDHKKVFKFKRLFSSISGKNDVAATATSPRIASAKVEDYCCRQGINIADTMDLPLPVLKMNRIVGRDDDRICTLWKRRHGDLGLQRLEIVSQIKARQIQHGLEPHG